MILIRISYFQKMLKSGEELLVERLEKFTGEGGVIKNEK